MSTGIKRDPRTGALLKGTAAINPGGRKKAFRTYLKELIGERGEKAYDGILAIAQGKTTIRALAREPGPNEDAHSAAMIPVVTKVPSIRERLDAWIFLTEQLNGKATQGIEMDLNINDATSPKLDEFTDDELDQFERFLERAIPEPEPVDAEIVTEDAPAETVEVPQLTAGLDLEPWEPVTHAELVEVFTVKPDDSLTVSESTVHSA